MADGVPASEIAKVKGEFPLREVAEVAMSYGEQTYTFIMTSPVREEWKKYRREITAAGSDIEKIEQAIEIAALAQIRWPSRDEVKALFDARPGIIQHFADELAKLAGSHAEVVAKKL